MADLELPTDLRDDLRTAWHRYVDRVAPFRPALHGYCRRLTRDLWDAEDLVQDTLLRVFGTLGHIHHDVRSPRAYLLRVATHLWIDTLRRRAREAAPLAAQAAEPGAPAAQPGAARDLGTLLLERLAPQERAAVLLKELFDLSLAETAEALGTSVGAVKAALQRGRERLREAGEGAGLPRAVPSVELVDRFVALYDARDKDGLVALMLDGGQIENVGCGLEYGRDDFPREDGWFHKALYGHDEWPPPFRYESARIERALYEGEPLILCFATRGGAEALEQILRIEERDGGIARLRGYAFCPESMRAVAEDLGLPVRTGLYRFPTPAPGQYY